MFKTPIYYINLQRAIQRNKYMINQFKSYNITNYKRINAVDGLLDNLDLVGSWENSNINKCAIACTFSHLSAIRTAYMYGHTDIIIMEDDVDLSIVMNNLDKFNNLIDLINRIDLVVCDIVSLYNTIQYNTQNKLIKWTDKFNGAVMYYIKRSAMKRLIDTYYRNGRIVLPPGIAIYADKLIYEINHSMVSTFPYVITVDLDSYIHPDHIQVHLTNNNNIKKFLLI